MEPNSDIIFIELDGFVRNRTFCDDEVLCEKYQQVLEAFVLEKIPLSDPQLKLAVLIQRSVYLGVLLQKTGPSGFDHFLAIVRVCTAATNHLMQRLSCYYFGVDRFHETATRSTNGVL